MNKVAQLTVLKTNTCDHSIGSYTNNLSYKLFMDYLNDIFIFIISC